MVLAAASGHTPARLVAVLSLAPWILGSPRAVFAQASRPCHGPDRLSFVQTGFTVGASRPGGRPPIILAHEPIAADRRADDGAARARPPALLQRSAGGSEASQTPTVTTNAEGDLSAFCTALLVNGSTLLIFVILFSFLRRLYPAVYSRNDEAGAAAPAEGTLFGWVVPSIKISIDDVNKACGLDHAMMIQFCDLVMKILLSVGLYQVFVFCPLHVHCGGHDAGEDRLSRIGFGNIKAGSWMCWLHAANMCVVVAVVMRLVHSAQKDDFLPRRFTWLRAMTHPRATTVLVEGVPAEYRSDSKLRGYFNDMFPGNRIVSAFVVKRTQKLKNLIGMLEAAKDQLAAAEQKQAERAKGGPAPDAPTLRDSVAKLEDLVQQERSRLAGDDGSSGAAGFVTFRARIDAMVALHIQYRSDNDEFVLAVPPAPSDVLYTHLTYQPHHQMGFELLGHAANIGLLLGFLPIVSFISIITDFKALRRNVKWFDVWMTSAPVFAQVIDAILASLALTLVMSFLPTILALINGGFFHLHAEAWAQNRLQRQYFWFMLFFVVLVTAIGSSLMQTAKELLEQPFLVFPLLAETLPEGSHFFFKYIVMQWVSHAMELLRIMQLIKFVVFRKLYGEGDARKLCEPEDQDYFGMGARCTRFTINFIVALIFCSLSPIIAVLSFISFAGCRLVYGFLFVHAETRKADLGGVFWVTSLYHIQYGMLVYIALMLGVLVKKGGSAGPWILGTPSIVIWVFYFVQFRKTQWECLPYEEAVRTEEPGKTDESYQQPELNVSEGAGQAWIGRLQARGLRLRDVVNAFRKGTPPTRKK